MGLCYGVVPCGRAMRSCYGGHAAAIARAWGKRLRVRRCPTVGLTGALDDALHEFRPETRVSSKFSLRTVTTVRGFVKKRDATSVQPPGRPACTGVGIYVVMTAGETGVLRTERGCEPCVTSGTGLRETLCTRPG